MIRAVFVLVCIGFTFAPDWFVKTRKLLCKFHWFMVSWLGCVCDWFCNCIGFDFLTAM